MQMGNVSQGGHGQVNNVKGDHAPKRNQGVKPPTGEVQEGGGLSIDDTVEISDEAQGLQ